MWECNCGSGIPCSSWSLPKRLVVCTTSVASRPLAFSKLLDFVRLAAHQSDLSLDPLQRARDGLAVGGLDLRAAVGVGGRPQR